MAAGVQDITIEAGATFQLDLEWRQPSADDATPGPLYDLTGCHARMHVRQRIGADVLLDLNDPDEITLGGAAGTIDIEIPADDTASLQGIKKAVYDLFIEFPSGVVEKVLKGKVVIEQAVTTEVTP